LKISNQGLNSGKIIRFFLFPDMLMVTFSRFIVITDKAFACGIAIVQAILETVRSFCCWFGNTPNYHFTDGTIRIYKF